MTKKVNRAEPLSETIIENYVSPDNKEHAWLSKNEDGTYHFLAYRTARQTKPCKNIGTKLTKLNSRVEKEYLAFVSDAKRAFEWRERDRIKCEREALEFKADLKVGSILSYSWGWEQTNWQFYQVVGFKGKATVILAELKQNCGPEEGFMTNKTEPIKDSFDSEKTFTKRLNPKYGWLNMDHGIAKIWDGKTKIATHYA